MPAYEGTLTEEELDLLGAQGFLVGAQNVDDARLILRRKIGNRLLLFVGEVESGHQRDISLPTLPLINRGERAVISTSGGT